jgi:hypothetical protein
LKSPFLKNFQKNACLEWLQRFEQGVCYQKVFLKKPKKPSLFISFPASLRVSAKPSHGVDAYDIINVLNLRMEGNVSWDLLTA